MSAAPMRMESAGVLRCTSLPPKKPPRQKHIIVIEKLSDSCAAVSHGYIHASSMRTTDHTYMNPRNR